MAVPTKDKRGVTDKNGAAVTANRNESEVPSIAGLTNTSLGGPLKIFSGSCNEPLAAEVANYLGMELGKITVKKFADGETYVQLQESIRGCDVFLIQSTSPPTNDNLMELLIMVDACKRASARNITVVLPYFGYARADKGLRKGSHHGQACCELVNGSGCGPFAFS